MPVKVAISKGGLEGRLPALAPVTRVKQVVLPVNARDTRAGYHRGKSAPGMPGTVSQSTVHRCLLGTHPLFTQCALTTTLDEAACRNTLCRCTVGTTLDSICKKNQW
jgi:hypothetical protein